MAFDLVAAYAEATTPFWVKDVTIGSVELNDAPQQITLKFSPGVDIDPSTLAAISIVRSGGAGDAFGNANDVTVVPGSIVVDDLPNQNQVVIRFAQTLPDDSYRIIVGPGLASTGSEDANPTTIDLRLDLGAFVTAVVPQPVEKVNGVLNQYRRQIHVYFNAEDPLLKSSAENPTFYRLYEIDAAGNDVGAAVHPRTVAYDAVTGKATLWFKDQFTGGRTYRFEVGGAGLPVNTTQITETDESAGSVNSAFSTAQNLGQIGLGTIEVTGSIAALPTKATPAGDLGFQSQPGVADEPGRSPSSGFFGLPFATVDPATGISVIPYNFQTNYGVDPQGNQLSNVITEAQKQRTREILELISLNAGVRFVETALDGMSIATGDVRAVSPTFTTANQVATSVVAGDPTTGLVVVDATEDWGQSEYGGQWFQAAMQGIGAVLGVQSWNGAQANGEAVFPSNYDTIDIRQFFAPNGSDIDLYRFVLTEAGVLSAETVVARPGEAVTSTLDSVLSLYKEEQVDGRTTRTLVARNDDSFGRDSFLNLDLAAGTYYVAVTSVGNTAINPEVSDSGNGGRTDGEYELKLGFTPASTTINSIVDLDGTAIDGDRDGKAGGTHTFWFNTAGLGNTVFVDKTAAVGGNGTLAAPFNSLKAALDTFGTKKILRVVGNAAGVPYLIGTDLSGKPLADGTTFNVPRNATVMIDAGAVFKLRGAIVDVGSSSQLVSRTGASLQVLGTPSANVVFTSFHDDTVGGDSDGLGPAAVGGQWGGLVFRADSDVASKKAFVNSVNQARITYGGGQVRVDSQVSSFAPIQMENARPSIAFNVITGSAGAAMAATPNSFEDTQNRIGPDIRGNTVTGNSINGLFVKIDTGFGRPLEQLSVPARWKNADLVYVLQENLVIAGGAGGYVDDAGVMMARASGSLQIDPGVVVKLLGSRIELERGLSRLVAEGDPNNRIIFTSLGDGRFGAGGTFDTNGAVADIVKPGDWGGIILNAGAKASIDSAYLAYGGGTTPIEGTFDDFNVIEVHQGELRLANSRLDNNADGKASSSRNGRGTNEAATVFVRGAQPIIIGNDFRENAGAVVSMNANSLTDVDRPDTGRVTGIIGRNDGYDGNQGPLIRGNTMSYTTGVAATLGLEVRAEQITVESVWDDTDIVHVLRNEITVGNFRTATGLRLQSSPDASLVVKLLGGAAGFTATGGAVDIPDRIGGTFQVVGQPGYPVIFTSVRDDSVGAGVNALGLIVTDTNNNGTATVPGPNDWRSLQFLPLANDRNVAVVVENESTITGGVGVNENTSEADVLGVLAPNLAKGTVSTTESAEQSGDENRRLGFEVHGTVAYDTPTDVDVYAFEGTAGSEVWIDVDKTSPGLDSVVELLDASGAVLARSVDTTAEGGIAQGEQVDGVPDAVAMDTMTFQLQHGGVLPGTISGTIYENSGLFPTAIQTFAIDTLGVITFANIIGADRLGATITPGVAAIGGSVDLATGQISLVFLGAIGGVSIDVRYAYATGSLSAVGGAALPMGAQPWLGNDFYSQNPKDAGMRVFLPGTAGTQQKYYVRVRSQPRYEAVTTGTDNGGVTATTLADYETGIATTNAGATSGRYELRIRLRQADEKPGSTVLYGDIRYAAIGIDVQGLPNHSLLTGDTAEHSTDDNNSSNVAQNVGNVLQSDQSSISIAGTILNAGDVDWFAFDVDAQVVASFAQATPLNYLPTVFDIDYGDGFRGDLTISVFDANGVLIYVGRDSNISEDQPGAGTGANFQDLARGSAGVLDPYIGSALLPTGRRYYVAVSSNERLPEVLDATYKDGATESLTRLEPLSSVARIVEDHIVAGAGGGGGVYPAATANTIIDATRDTFTLSAYVTPFDLSDVTLFVSTAYTLRTVDALRGGVETTLEDNYNQASAIGDLVMRSDGRLFSYSGLRNTADVAGEVDLLDTVTGARTSWGKDEIKDRDPAATPPNIQQVTTDRVDAIAWQRTNVGEYDQLYYSVWDGANQSSRLYRANPDNRSADFVDKQPWGFKGYIQDVVMVDDGTGNMVPQLGTTIGQVGGMAFLNGTLYGVDSYGQFFSIDQGTGAFTLIPLSQPLTVDFRGLSVGPQNLGGGVFANTLFAIDATGMLHAFDEAGTLLPVFDADGNGVAESFEVDTGVGGATGLAFSPLDVNLWHPTTYRKDDAGHGINATPDNTRITDQGGATSMYFGYEEWQSGTPTYAYYSATNGQYGVVAPNWQRDLSTNAAFPNTYNLPGGAYGSLTTDAFSLEAYTQADKPTLYFNYWLDTQKAEGKTNQMRDSARVFVSVDGGLTWDVVATNNSAKSSSQTENAELPVTPTTSAAITGYSNQVVQELFDSASWRQARIDLGQFAGNADVRLRFDFSTAGEFDPTAAWKTSKPVAVDVADDTFVSFSDVSNLVNVAGLTMVGPDGVPLGLVVAVDLDTNSVELDTAVTIAADTVVTFIDGTGANTLNNIQGLAGTTGNFTNADRGANNQFGGFAIDDIVVGFAERGEMVTKAPAANTNFFDTATQTFGNTQQVLQGPYQLEIRRGAEFALDTAASPFVYQRFDTNTPLIPEAGTSSTYLGGYVYGPTTGDQNVERQQGQFIIANNIITDSGSYGIRIDAGARTGELPASGSPRNLPVLNTGRLVPGTVITNNVIASSGTAGILFSGDPNTGNVPLAPVPFGRIVNNTIYGGDVARGTGVAITQNAAPTIINNLFANLATGVSVDGTSQNDGAGNARTVVAASAYANVATPVTGIAQNQALVLAGDPFVNARSRNFYLAEGTAAIDSALNALQDRSQMVAVTAPIGVSPSPIVAPDHDLYGQLRSDDPTQANASGLGANVFKDRGAIDRVDTTQPTAWVASPLDGSVDDLDPRPDYVLAVRSAGRSATEFHINLLDVGVGIDKSTVSAEAFMLARDGVVLIEGVDYMFRYLDTSNRVVLESTSVYPFGTYTITLVTRPTQLGVTGLLTDLANNTLLQNQADGTRVFTVVLADVPSAPWGVAAAAGDAAVLLTWNAPTWSGTSPIRNYRIQYSNDGGVTWATYPRASQSTDTSYLMTGLTNGVPYAFRVAAVNGVGRGDYSVPSSVVTPAITAPTAPTNVAAVRAGAGAITLTWSAPLVVSPDAPIWDYAIQYSINNGASWTTYADGINANTSATLTGLAVGTPHLFRVVANNKNGWGDWSSTVALTPYAPASAPTITSATAGDALVSVAWTTPSGNGLPVTGYVVNCSSATDTKQIVVGPGNSAVVTGLVNGTSYTVRVVALTAYGAGDWSTATGPVTPLALPGVPEGISATGRDASAVVSWVAPTNTGGRPITDYVVQYRLASAASWTTFSHAASTATSQVVTGLVNGSAYVFRVAAVTSVGVGPFTAATGSVTPMPLAAAPTRLTGTAGGGVVSLVWTAPTSTGGLSITDYVVQYSTNGGGSWVTANDGVSTITRASLSLPSGVNYIFRVAAVTAGGIGWFSANSAVLRP